MPSVFREYTLGDRGDMIGRGGGETGGLGDTGMSELRTSTLSKDSRRPSCETV
jgi:hypothetical protein